MLAQQALKEAIEAVDKHLPGRHDQKTHGKPWSRTSAKEFTNLRPRLVTVSRTPIEFGYRLPSGEYVQPRHSHADVFVAAGLKDDEDGPDSGDAAWLNGWIRIQEEDEDGIVVNLEVPVNAVNAIKGTVKDYVDRGARVIDVVLELAPDRYGKTFIVKPKTWERDVEKILLARFDKHLAGKHDQKRHGRLGPVDDQSEFAFAPDPNAITKGKVVILDDGEVYRATGRATRSYDRANSLVDALKEAYPGTKYHLYVVDGLINILQVGMVGPINTVLKTTKKPKVVTPTPDPITPVISKVLIPTDKTRQYLTELLGVKGRMSDRYGNHEKAAVMLAAGEMLLQKSLDKVQIDVPKYLVDRAQADTGFKLTLPQPEPMTPESIPANYYLVTSDEALKIAQNEDMHYRRLVDTSVPSDVTRNLESVMGQEIRSNILKTVLDEASPSRYKYDNDLDKTIKVTYSDRWEKEQKKLGQNGMSNLYASEDWLEKNLLTDEAPPSVKVSATRRAHASKGDGLYLSTKPSLAWNVGSALVHERGHWVEFYNPDVLDASKDFLQARISSTESVRLTGGYRRDERAYRDKFVDPYVGKVYDNDTEIMSMGMEHMYSNPVLFFRQDPDHYLFTLAALYGKHRPKI